MSQSDKNGRRLSDAQQAEAVERNLNDLIAAVRRREAEGNFVDCEVIVKATILVVNGAAADEAMAECGIPVEQK